MTRLPAAERLLAVRRATLAASESGFRWALDMRRTKPLLPVTDYDRRLDELHRARRLYRLGVIRVDRLRQGKAP